MSLNEFLRELLKAIGDLVIIDVGSLRIILAVVFLLAGVLLRQVFAKGIIGILLHFAKKIKTKLGEMVVYAFEKPVRSLILGFAIWLSASILAPPPFLQKILNRLLRSFVVFALFWFFYRALDPVFWVFEHFVNRNEKKIDRALNRFLKQTLQILIIIFALFVIIREWGYNISSLIAGLGIGGLAFALAAKDAFSNLLGSITIMLDKPFGIGDWIETEKTEGIVEELGFRSTKIRTFEQAIVSVPNSIMSNEPITNWTRMGKRRITFSLHIPLDTPQDRIRLLLDKIREMLKAHPEIHQEMIVVHVESFGHGTLELLFYFFTKTTSWVTYMAVKEDVNLKVLEIFEEIGIPLALPAQRFVLDKGSGLERS